MLNELFRSYKKIIILAVLMGSTVIFWFFGCHRNQDPVSSAVKWTKEKYESGGYGYRFETGDLNGKVVFGVKGYTVKNKNIPVRVEVKSSEDDFSGVVKIRIPGNLSGGVAYQAGFSCKKSENTSIAFTVPQLGNASYFCFEICDQYENVLLSEMEIPAYSEWNQEEDQIDQQICFGVLSDQMNHLAFMDKLLLSTEDQNIGIRTIGMDAHTFPASLIDLDMLSGIYIDSFDLSTLSDKQKTVLLTWIKRGGHLVIATGRYGQKNLRGFGKEIGAFSGPVDLGRLYFGDQTEFSGEIGLYLNQLRFEEEAGWKMVNWSDPASYYERNFGEGCIQILRFSFTDESLLQWNRFNEMTKSLMKHLMENVFESNMDEESGLWNMEMALNGFIQSQIPNAFFYGIFFIFYLCMLTFIAYFLLRKQNKREYIWVVVPLLSCLFTFFLLVRTRGNTNTPQYNQNALSAIRIVDDQSKKNNIYMLYQNAEGEGKSLDLISAIDEVKPLDFEYGQEVVDYSRLRRIHEDYTISHTIKGYNLLFAEATPGTIRMLEMTENKSMNYAEKTKVFESDFHGEHTTFSGQIKNVSDKNFDKVLVVRGNQFCLSDGLASGKTVDLSREEIRCWSQNELDSDIFLPDYDHMVTQYILNCLSYRYIKNNSNLSDYIVIGISLEDKFPLLRKGNTLGNQVSVYVNHVSKEVPEKAECQVNINLEYLKDNVTYRDLLLKLDNEDKIEAEYRFDSNKIVWAMARNQDDYTGKIYAYNYQTEEMDEIFLKKGEVMDCEALEPYLSEMNDMKLLYKMSENEGEDMKKELPVLSIWLKKIVRKG